MQMALKSLLLMRLIPDVIYIFIQDLWYGDWDAFIKSEVLDNSAYIILSICVHFYPTLDSFCRGMNLFIM